MKHSLTDTLPRWLLTWLVCVALDLGLAELLRVDGRWWLTVLALLLWCGLLAVAERFGRFWAALALWAAALGLCLLLADQRLLAEAALALLARTGKAGDYGELVLLLLCATAALPLSALLRFYWMRAALSLGWTALWIAAALSEWSLPRLVPAALLPLLLLTLVETSRRLRREPEPGRPQQSALLLSLLPMALLLLLLPAPEEPYDYPLLRAVTEKVEQLWHDAETTLYYRHEGDREFGLSFNGVSDEAELGEERKDGSAGIIYVRPGQVPDGALYLFGNTWDHFDGQGWSASLRPSTTELLNWRLDTAEHIYALWKLLVAEGDTARFSDYFRTNSVFLSCRNLNLRTMFTVMNATHIYTDVARFPYDDAPTGSLFDYVQQNDVWYRISFLEANVRTRGALIAAAERADYDAEATLPRWREIAEEYHRFFHLDLPNDLSLEKTFASRAALIRRVYLDTSSVSDRARALAEEITADCGSDTERIAAIAAYLQENYRYTLQPDPAPEGEDFLDWLLFDYREGYCAWYATAAVLLARSVDVPARYVQGFRCKLIEDGYTTVDPGDAHAWCECYIGGYGWVTVEATPGFEGDGVGWLTGAEKEALPDSETEAEDAPEELPGDEEREHDFAVPVLPAALMRGEEAEESVSEPEVEPETSRWLLFLIPAGTLAALAAVWLGLRARRKRRYAAADPAARLRMDLEVLLRDLRGKGYPRRPEEALRQYFARLPWHYLLANEAEAEEMAALYDRTFFAQTTPSEAELTRHRAFAARFRPRTLRQWLIWYRLQ